LIFFGKKEFWSEIHQRSLILGINKVMQFYLLTSRKLKIKQKVSVKDIFQLISDKKHIFTITLKIKCTTFFTYYFEIALEKILSFRKVSYSPKSGTIEKDFLIFRFANIKIYLEKLA
jgi:hypothetical protein